MDADWITTLGEIIARRRIIQRELDGRPREADREKRHQEQVATVASVMDRLFEAAVDEAQIEPGMRLLDVGAGLCRTSAEWAARGADVVAVETEASNLLHLSFAGIHTEPPEEYVTPNGHRLTARDPRPLPDYFTRICAPVHRLPFRTGAFDVVFCRSVLHHLHDLSGALREMLRVLRPGGLLVACSEPIRSILDREDHYLVEVTDKEEGLNEQAPALCDYRRAMAAGTTGLTVQAWPNPHRFESKRVFDLIPYNYHRHLVGGERVTGWRIAKLYPVSSSANLYATRDLTRIPKPAPSRDTLDDFTASEFADVYFPPSLAESVRAFPQTTAHLADAHRRLLAAHRPPCATFVPGLTAERDLRIGWRRIVKDHHGCPWRHTSRTALVTLSRPARATRLEMEIAPPPPVPREALSGSLPGLPPPPANTESTGRVLVNGQEVGRFSGLRPGWQRLSFPLPPDGSQPVADVEIENTGTVLSAAEGKPAELGVAVRWIRIV